VINDAQARDRRKLPLEDAVRVDGVWQGTQVDWRFGVHKAEKVSVRDLQEAQNRSEHALDLGRLGEQVNILSLRLVQAEEQGSIEQWQVPQMEAQGSILKTVEELLAEQASYSSVQAPKVEQGT
jgi:hypothetical protein